MYWMLRSGAAYAQLVRRQRSPGATLVNGSSSLDKSVDDAAMVGVPSDRATSDVTVEIGGQTDPSFLCQACQIETNSQKHVTSWPVLKFLPQDNARIHTVIRSEFRP